MDEQVYMNEKDNKVEVRWTEGNLLGKERMDTG
jgi:hypothetical protein